ncbi:hypothetical protein N7G274_006191 [Stereocaulon virgatum]|uniref:Uncharacterized protein n=1 Tax=Stereocaulon virgatum TaxID=373712 RepID=A0ABR4A786_9LECA
MKLFDAAAKMNGGEVQLEQLAAATGADPLLIIRIVQIYAGMGVFKEVRKHTFISTLLATTFVVGSPLTDAVTHIFVDLVVGFCNKLMNVSVNRTFHIGILSRLPEY